MKLLDFATNDSLKQSQVARDVARTELVREALIKAQNELTETEAKFDLIMAKQQKYAADEEEKLLIVKEKLQKEVEDLEARQKVAHFPIVPSERKAYDNLERSKQTLLSAELQKQKNEEIEEKLIDKLDDLSERDRMLDKRDEKIVVLEISIRDQKLALDSSAKSLNVEWSNLHEKVKEREAEWEQRENIISLHEANLSEREDKLFEEKEQLKLDRERLASDRLTLLAAFGELKQKRVSK